MNSTSPELGDIGARGGPGWVVPAAAGCACCEGAGGGGWCCGLERTAGSARKPCLTPLLRHFPSPTPHTWAEMGVGVDTLHPPRTRGQTETGERLTRGLGLRNHVISISVPFHGEVLCEKHLGHMEYPAMDDHWMAEWMDE